MTRSPPQRAVRVKGSTGTPAPLPPLGGDVDPEALLLFEF